MLAVRKWAEGKPLIIAIAAPQLATMAQDLHLAFKDTKNRNLLAYNFPLPDLREWVRLYRFHREPEQLFGPSLVNFHHLLQLLYLWLTALVKFPEKFRSLLIPALKLSGSFPS